MNNIRNELEKIIIELTFDFISFRFISFQYPTIKKNCKFTESFDSHLFGTKKGS